MLQVLSKTHSKLLLSVSRTYLVFGVVSLAVDLGFKGGEVTAQAVVCSLPLCSGLSA